MGRISDALSKLKLNENAAQVPFGKMTAKDMIKLLYHLAEVYDAEALMPEVTVKKKLQVFKNFARVNSLSHLLPSVKDMKRPKKCSRLVNYLLDMLEQKYGADLYTRKSWPVACKELPKIENVISVGSYNFDHLDLNPDAVPPGTSGASAFPGVKAVLPKSDLPKPASVSESEAKPDDVKNNKAAPTMSTAGALEMTATKLNDESGSQSQDGVDSPVNVLPKTISSPRIIAAESNSEGAGMSSSKEKVSSSEPKTIIGKAKKRQLEPAVLNESNSVQKKRKTEDRASKQFIEALEDLSNIKPIVEVVGWDKVIFTNQRIWHTLQKLIFARVLLGKELTKYNAKKVETAMETKVILAKKISQEDVKTIKVKLGKLVKQIRNAVPDELSENMKCAVNSSCENLKLIIQNTNNSNM